MHGRRVGLAGIALAAFLFLGQEVAAQNGTLTGRVTDVETGQPLVAAQIQVLGGGQSTGGLTDNSGVYRMQLPAGNYSIVVTSVGHQTARFGPIRVNAGSATTYDIELTSMALALNEVIVSVGRTPEKQVDAPATTHLIGLTEIAERPAVTPVDHLRSTPGVDIITSGVQSSNVVIRGFNNIFSGALHALTDNRIAGVPSLRVNLLHWAPTTNEDIERIEVVLGPGSALYGPNTANGVLHIMTKSPLDYQGTTVTMGYGEQNVFQGTFRTAFLLGEDFGFKLSGSYLQGDEWEYTDPTEAAAQASAAADPAACLANKAIRGLSAIGQEACGRVGTRDFDIERYGVEARADYRFAEDGTFVATYGRTKGSGVELTGLGAAQVTDWVYDFFQARLRKGRFFTQAYLNRSDAGGTWLLRDGVPLVDQSSLMVAQIQHGFGLADGRQDFTYGFDYFGTRPDTKGTINGSWEDVDDMDEWGIYVQSKTELSDKLDLIFAGRMDDHSLLDEKVFSPRAALVIKPSESQSFRLTYNRAFSTPSSLNFFLDISGGAAPAPLGPLGYTTRAYGTGPNGYSFQNADGSLHGMRSPFNPAQFGGSGQRLPANAATMWQLAVGVLAAQAAVDPNLAPLAPLLPLLGSLSPSDSDIAIMLLDINTFEVSPLAGSTIADVPGIQESYTETFEVGWQSIIDDKVRVSADVYYMKKNNFVSPLLVQTPMLLLNGQDIASFVTVPIVTALTQQFIAGGLDPATALAQATATAAGVIPVLAAGMAGIPLGVATSESLDGVGGSDIIVTYRNVGDVSFWGADFAFSWLVNSEWTLNGTYSHVSDDYFEIEDGTPIALNAPKDKYSASAVYRNVTSGFNAEARVRYTSQFPAESAGFVGTRCLPGGGTGGLFEEDCVDKATILDLNLGYRVPRSAATLQLSINNVLNKEYRSFVGVPNIGRFAMVRVKYDLF